MWPFQRHRSAASRPVPRTLLARNVDRFEPRTLLSAIQTTGAEGVSIATASALDVDPAVASNSAGAFVVVDYVHGAVDGSGFTVVARAFGANGVATTAPFQVNTTTVGSQWRPDVAMAADGSFVVVWQNHGNSDGQADIFARRFNAAGQPLSGEFRVNVFLTGDQINPAISMAPDGRFVVVWEDNFGLDGDAQGIFGRFFQANGTPVGGDFQINGQQDQNDFIGSQVDPDVAMDASGAFAVVWEGPLASGGRGIKLRRFDSGGASTTNEVHVSDIGGNLFPRPNHGRVGSNGNGDLVIAWAEDGLGGDSSTERNIFARRYSSNRTPQPISPAFQVNQTTTSDQEEAAVGISPNGDFLISWQSTHPADGFDDVFAQFYNADGTRSGSEFRVNTTSSRDQREPDIAFPSSTRAIVTWQGLGVGATGLDIYHQRFDVTVPVVLDDTTVSVDAQNRLLITDTGTATDDDLTVTLNMAGDVVITDPNARLGTAIAGAVLSGDAHTLTVPRSRFGSFVQADLRDGNDKFDSSQLSIQARVFAGSGNDLIQTGALADSVAAGTGNDTVDTGAGNDTTDGGNGADSIDGGSGNDEIFGDDGFDVLSGGDGADLIRGGSGNDLISGGPGFDTIHGGAHNDTISAGGGNDTVFAGSGDDSAAGDAGFDRVLGEDGNDIVSGGSENDFVRGGKGADILHGNEGNDEILGDEQPDTIFGGPGNDNIDGGSADDRIFADAGNDTANGGAGADFIRGGAGDDLLNGSSGFDRLFGDGNNDNLNGGNQNDVLFGGSGNDDLSGDAGNDQIFADDGADTASGGTGNDLVRGGRGFDLLRGNDGSDSLHGDQQNDTLDGGFGSDMLTGGDGADLINGDPTDTVVSDADDNVQIFAPEDTNVSVDSQNRLVIADVRTTTNDQLTVTLNMAGDVVITDPAARLSTAIAGAVLSGDRHTLTVPRSRFGTIIQADLGDGNDQFDSSQLPIRARVFAGNGNDLIRTGLLGDSVNAGTGNDTVATGAGNDTTRGGNGTDSIDGGIGDDQIFGDDGFDNLSGGNGADFIRGGNGNDLISGGAGFDTINGDGHNDTISGGDGDDRVFAGGGDDLVSGDAGFDRVLGEDGNDVVSGGTENDFVRGGRGADLLHGNEGNDEILGDELPDTIFGGSGNDLIEGGTSEDRIYGDSGDDTASGDGGADLIRGGAGNDQLNGGTGFDTLFGDDHNDELSGGDQNDTFFGGRGNDDISGDAGDDRIFTDDGADTASGGTGNDFIRGGRGADILRGNNGSDTIFGDQQNDTVDGGANDDTLTGGDGADLYLTDGNDRINSDSDDSTQFPQLVETTVSRDGSGSLVITDTGSVTNDRLTVTTNSNGDYVITDPTVRLTTSIFSTIVNGVTVPGATESADGHTVTVPRGRILGTVVVQLGGGNDRFEVGQLPTGTVVNGGTGNDLIITGLNSDQINAGDGDDTVFSGGSGDTIDGGAGNDRLFGDIGNDVIIGGSGNDFIRGGTGSDQLRGDSGNDTLFGDQQLDTLTGGTGNGSADPGDSFPDAASGEINESFMPAVMAALDLV